MSGEGARWGVKHPGPRARVASKPTPATQTILLYQGLGFLSLFSFALFLFGGDLGLLTFLAKPTVSLRASCVMKLLTIPLVKS